MARQNGYRERYVDYFEVDHLISLTGEPYNEIDPHAGIAKLHQKQSHTGLLTLRCVLGLAMRNGKKVIVVMNRQTKEEIEVFPLGIITNLYHQSSSDPREPYNRKVILTLSRSPFKEMHEENVPEMHIFQAVYQTAPEVVERISHFKSAEHNEDDYPYQPADDDLNRRDPTTRSLASVTSTIAKRFPHNRGSGLGALPIRGTDHNDRMNGGPDPGRADKEIYLVNRCFEDIERFMSKLQHAVLQYNTAKSRISGSSSKSSARSVKKGTLSTRNPYVRAQLPGRTDFMECFKLIKLALIVLTRLNGVATGSPSPLDSIHALFVILEIITDASRDPQNKNPVLGRSAVSPLLTRDTVELLENILNAREKDVWKELGEAWTVPRDSWRGTFVPSYLPVFSDGFTPTLWDYDENIFTQSTSVSALPGDRDNDSERF